MFVVSTKAELELGFWASPAILSLISNFKDIMVIAIAK